MKILKPLLGPNPKSPRLLVWKASLSKHFYGFLLPRTSVQKSSNLEFCIIWVCHVFTKLQPGGYFNSHLCVLPLPKSLVQDIKPAGLRYNFQP